jgi:hypothetical protein
VGSPAHQVRELLIHDLYYLLARTERLRDLGPGSSISHLAHEVLDDCVVHVGLKQGEPDLTRNLFYLVLGEVAGAAHPVECRVKPLS